MTDGNALALTLSFILEKKIVYNLFDFVCLIAFVLLFRMFSNP